MQRNGVHEAGFATRKRCDLGKVSPSVLSLYFFMDLEGFLGELMKNYTKFLEPVLVFVFKDSLLNSIS